MLLVIGIWFAPALPLKITKIRDPFSKTIKMGFLPMGFLNPAMARANKKLR